MEPTREEEEEKNEQDPTNLGDTNFNREQLSGDIYVSLEDIIKSLGERKRKGKSYSFNNPKSYDYVYNKETLEQLKNRIWRSIRKTAEDFAKERERERKRMNEQTKALIEKYSEAFKKAWKASMKYGPDFRFKAAGFPGGVIMLYEADDSLQFGDTIEHDYPNIRVAWDAIKGESKITESLLQEYFAKASGGKWNGDSTEGYINGDGICIFKGNTPEFFAETEAEIDVKAIVESGREQIKKSLNL